MKDRILTACHREETGNPFRDEQGGPKLYIQAGSKMNDIPFNDEDPF